MAATPLGPLHQQIARVSRRLLLQSFVQYLIWCWAGALVLSAVGFLVQLLLQPTISGLAFEPAQRWLAAGGVVGLATVVAVVLALVRSPSKPYAALELDEKFNLKERVTTLLLLTPEQLASPAGQALFGDVSQRIDKLDIASRFPIHVPWSAALVPVCAVLLALAALVPPFTSKAIASTDEERPIPPANAREIDKKLAELQRKKPLDPKLAEKPKSEELERIETELEKIANKPRENRDQLRERIKELTNLEDQMKSREKDLAEKSKSLKQQMQQLDKLMDKDSKDGPGKDLQKALSEGKLDKAAEEVERLMKKLKDNELTQKEQEQLQKQLKDLQEKLDRLAKQQNKEDQLKQLHKDGKLDAETLKRELEQLKKDSEKLKDLKDLAEQLKQCQECMKKGDTQGAAEGLKKASGQLKGMKLDENEMKDLQDQLQRLQEAKGEMCKGCQGKGENEGEQDENSKAGGRPGGRRKVAPEGKQGSFDEKAKVDFDNKGKKIFDGYAPGENYRKKTQAELEGEIKSASQEAPEAIEQQRIPKAAREMSKGYFKNLGGQKEKEKEKK